MGWYDLICLWFGRIMIGGSGLLTLMIALSCLYLIMTSGE